MIKNSAKIIGLLAVLFSTACTSMHWDNNFGVPASLDMTPPPGSEEYQAGWSDGCHTAVAGFGNQFTKVFYSPRKNADLALNPDYNHAWKDAYGYCRVFLKSTALNGDGNYGRYGPLF